MPRPLSRNTKLLLATILLVVLIFTFYTPFLLINSDSVHGFIAMNGYYWTGKWNTTLEYNPATHHLYEKFLTWWSPGQWLAPLFFIKFLHLHLGTSVTLVNFLSNFFGTVGFFLVFKKYGFDRLTIWISVILILLSSSILAAYYNYNGGESLNFLVFPWIIISQNLLVRRFWKYIMPGVILFISFICKLQMLIVVPPLLFLLVFIQTESNNFGFLPNKAFRFREPRLKNYLPLFISLIPVILFIYFSFIANGDTPAHSTKQFSLSPENFLFPVSSPITSIYFFDSLHYFFYPKPLLYNAYLFLITILVISCLLYITRHFGEYDPEKRKYIFLVFILYLISICTFIVLYTRGSPVDINPRHLKLSSYLLYPVLVSVALKKFNKSWVLGSLTLLAVFAISNHIRLTRVWTKNTFVTNSGFRLFREDMPRDLKEKLDSQIRTKTIVISGYEDRYAIDNHLILPVLSRKDIRGDLAPYEYPVIFVDSLPLLNTSLK